MLFNYLDTRIGMLNSWASGYCCKISVLLAISLTLIGCGVWGPKERGAYVGSFSWPNPPPDVQQIIVGVPTGSLDWNGYLAFWRHADRFEITYRQEKGESTAKIVRLVYEQHDSTNIRHQEIKTSPTSKLSVSISECIASIELFFTDEKPIEKINGVYNLENCKINSVQQGA
jgi:hypothetical protein